jgi:two-component system LytT family response regulator
MHLLIVDDERPARERLRRMLALEPGIDSVREAADGVQALQMVERDPPDALLLDIEMPELSGIDVAASLPAPAPLVVFVTAYDAYALRAFDAEAVDYLLKPFDQLRLRRALERLRMRIATPVPAPAPAAALALAQPRATSCGAPRQLLVQERGATRVVQVADIAWLETADNYVALHTAAPGCAPLLRQSLGALLDRLGPAFARCHRRAAVRLTAIARIEPLDKGDCELVLASGVRVPCSRQYRPALLARLDPARPA